MSEWTFLTNHAYVLLCVAGEPTLTLRQVALRVGVTERAVQRLLRDLEDGGYLRRVREGRNNRYQVLREVPPRHPLERGLEALLGVAQPADAFRIARNASFID